MQQWLDRRQCSKKCGSIHKLRGCISGTSYTTTVLHVVTNGWSRKLQFYWCTPTTAYDGPYSYYVKHAGSTSARSLPQWVPWSHIFGLQFWCLWIIIVHGYISISGWPGTSVWSLISRFFQLRKLVWCVLRSSRSGDDFVWHPIEWGGSWSGTC